MRAPDIVGREFERRALDDLLAAVPSISQAGIIRGSAGMGKTTLIEYAVRSAETAGMRVLRAGPTPSESGLSYSALADLIGADLDRLAPKLSKPQARALLVALRKDDPADERIDQHSIAAGFRSLMDLYVAESPTVLVIDDTPWLDPASSAVLEFTARRIPARSLGILLAERPGPPSPLSETVRSAFGSSALTVLELEPLGLDDIHRVLETHAGWVPTHPILSQLVHMTGGNPFYSLQISRTLRAESANAARSDDTLRLPGGVVLSLGLRVGPFPAPCQHALLLVALAARPSLTLIGRALGGPAAQALAPAQQQGVVDVDDRTGRVCFTHPLLAATVIESATTAERQSAHAALAQADAESEQSARHLALASDAPGEAAARALEDAARSAMLRGAPVTAVDLAALSLHATQSDGPEEDRRRLLLSEGLMLAGDFPGARAELQLLLKASDTNIRWHACMLLARLTSRTEDPAAAVALAAEAVRSADSDAAEAAARVELALLSSHDPQRGLAEAERAISVIRRAAQVDSHLLGRAHFAVMDCSTSLGRPLDRELAAQVPDPGIDRSEARVVDRVGYRLGNVLLCHDDVAWTRRVLERALEVAAEEGDEGSRPTILDDLSQLEVIAGRWPIARQLATQQRDSAVRAGQLKLVCAAEETLASIDVREGRFAKATLRVEQSMALRHDYSDPWEDAYCLRTRGLLHLLQGDARNAVADLVAVQRICAETGVVSPGVLRYEGDLIESRVLMGDLDPAMTLADSLSERAAVGQLVSAASAAARGRGLVLAAGGDLDRALEHQRDSVSLSRSVDVPLELGRSLLALGQLHRRRREKRLAGIALSEAVQLLDDLGAVPWADRARAEAQRLGIRPSDSGQLTATESQVAELAASGLSNPEIGARLSMSRKTVEFNLSKVYRKLEVRRRAELPARLARLDEQSGASGTSSDQV